MGEWLVPTIMGIQAVALALISRLRWRCFPDENNRCVCVSGCTEHALIPEAGGIASSEFVINDQKVLLVSSKNQLFCK